MEMPDNSWLEMELDKSCDLRYPTTPASEGNVEIHDGPWQLDPS